MKSIELTVTSDGEVTIDKKGFKGKQCEAFKWLEEALGTTTKSTRKPEYFQEEVRSQKVGG